MTNIGGTRLMAALATLFNVLALNLVLLIASLPVVTLPAALDAASAALDSWRRDGDDRVVAGFLAALRTRNPFRATVTTGVPLAAAALGVAEVIHFAHSTINHSTINHSATNHSATNHSATNHGTALPDYLWLGLGTGALLVTLAALGYVIQIGADAPALPPVEVWSLSARLAIRNLPVTGPLALVPLAAAALLAAVDPGLLLLGLPLLVLCALKGTARLGLRRAGLAS